MKVREPSQETMYFQDLTLHQIKKITKKENKDTTATVHIFGQRFRLWYLQMMTSKKILKTRKSPVTTTR